MSNLIASLWRAQTFAYLAYHLSWFLFGFYPCENVELVFISIPSSSSSKTDFICISCVVLDVGGFIGLSFIERSCKRICLIWSHPHMMYYDVSAHDLVKLFVMIPTSQRSLKTEFGCSRYRRFRVDVLAVLCRPETPV